MYAPRASRQDRDAETLKFLVRDQKISLRVSSWLSVVSSLIFVAELAVIALATTTLIDTSSIQSVGRYVLSFAFLVGLRIACDFLAIRFATFAAEEIKAATRNKVTGAISRISPYDKKRPHAGELATILSSHIEALGPFLTRYQPARLRTAVVPFVILAITAWFSWVAALVLLVTGPLIPVFMALIGGRAREASEHQLREIGSVNGALLDRLQGITTLQLFDAVERATEALTREGQRIRERTMAVLRIAFLSSAVLELFGALGVAFAAVYIGFSLLGHLNFGAYGELTLFGGLFVLMIAPEYFRPLREFAVAYHDKAAALAATKEISRILSGDFLLLPTPRSGNGATAIKASQVTLTIDNRQLINEFSLAVSHGEKIALVGPSGAGKSLLLALLGQLIAPTQGMIETNGKIAWLGQKPSFLHGSLRSNLILYGEGASRDRIEDAVVSAQAEEIVAKLGRGYGELLKENASNLSGGEAQRIALARLALSDAPIILADEPTEHLDEQTANAVIDGIINLAQGRTLIIATHDARIVSRMTRVIDVRQLSLAPQLENAA